ncbi:hypothetical protein V6N12_057012 [Hibiscus sabdariffa]|uniref:Uncharacterized protein n=1 Tax=Hibiscus sabdariffa TaxID=183260 RepID=A0ABR2DD32_9ROSI
MAFEHFDERGLQPKTSSYMEDVQLNTNWDDVICHICLDFPHNEVLLQCSSYEDGCRAFVCDTDHMHSNCLDRFKNAHGMSSLSISETSSIANIQLAVSEDNCRPTCPLCRGQVTGWTIVDKAHLLLHEKKHSCEEEQCKFAGTYLELQKHAQLEYPHACPSRIDPARQLDWEKFSAVLRDSRCFEHYTFRSPTRSGSWTLCVYWLDLFLPFTKQTVDGFAVNFHRAGKHKIFKTSNTSEIVITWGLSYQLIWDILMQALNDIILHANVRPDCLHSWSIIAIMLGICFLVCTVVKAILLYLKSNAEFLLLYDYSFVFIVLPKEIAFCFGEKRNGKG